MSYNNNTHYKPRYGKNSSKKSYDSGSSGNRDSSNLLNNQSSSSYIGGGSKDYEGTSSSSNSGSYYSRREMYGNSGYRSRYESYTPKNSGSGSSSYYRGNSNGGSTYYGSGSHLSNAHGSSGGPSGSSNLGGGSSGNNRRWQGFDRLYDSYSKYQDSGNDKFISRTGSYSNVKKEYGSNDQKDDRRKSSMGSSSRYGSSGSPHDTWVPRSGNDDHSFKDRRYFDGNDHRTSNEASRKSSLKGDNSPMHRSDSRKSSHGDITSARSRNASKESSRRSSIIQNDGKIGLESPKSLNIDRNNTKQSNLIVPSSDPQVEKVPEVSGTTITSTTSTPTATVTATATAPTSTPTSSIVPPARQLKKKTSFTDYLKSAKAKSKEDRETDKEDKHETKENLEVKEVAEPIREILTVKELSVEKDDQKDEDIENNISASTENVKSEDPKPIADGKKTSPSEEKEDEKLVNDISIDHNDNDNEKEDEKEDEEVDFKRKLFNSDSFADTSVLSPVNESDVDFNFEELAAIPESTKEEVKTLKEEETKTSKHEPDDQDDVEIDGNVSETETVVADDLPTLDQGEKLIRKTSADSERHALKKEQVEDLIPENDHEDSSPHDKEHVDTIDDDKMEEDKVDEDDNGLENDDDEKKSPAEILEEPTTKITENRDAEDKEVFVQETDSATNIEDEVMENNVGTSDKQPSIIRQESKPIIKSKKLPYKLKRDSSGRSLLQRACKKGNFEDVQSYIERGASSNEKDFCGFTCLHEAALEGHTEIVEYLIKHGANVNAKADEAGDSETPLIDAAENKHLDTVKILLKYDADPTIFNIDGFTALTKIYNEHDGEEGYDEIIEVLEEANSKFTNRVTREIHSASGSPESNGSIIEDPNDLYFANLIKRKGIYKYAAENSKEATAEYFVSGHSLEAKPDILILAARNGHTELVDIILGLNPTPFNIDTESSCGVTALLASVGRGHFDIVDSLLSKGADPFKVRKRDGLNALEIAQHSPHFDTREVNVIVKHMEKKSGTKIISSVPSRVASRVTSRVTSRAPSVPITSEDEEENEIYQTTKEPEEPLKEDEKEEEEEETAEETGSKENEDVVMEQEEPQEKEKENEIEENKNKDDDKDKVEDKDEEIKHVPVNDAPVESTRQEDRIVEQSDIKYGTNTVLEKVPSNEERKRKHLEIEDDEAEEQINLKRTKSDTKLKSLKKESSPQVQPQAVHIERPSSATSTPPPQSVLSKIQEEQKIRNAEETRLWQEKVEAKKRARREMFLKSEKEKEQKRKEEEEKRVEEEKRIAKEKEEEKLRLAKQAEEKSKELLERKVALRKRLTQDHYPIGLRYVRFDGEPTDGTIKKYLPLYVFVIDNKRYVTDLQLSLITSTIVTKVLENVNDDEKRVITTDEKDKLWKLFFKFIGLDSKNQNQDIGTLRKEGLQRFQNLLIHFMDEKAAKEYLNGFPQVSEQIKENQIEVSLDSLSGFDDTVSEGLVIDGNEEIVIDSKKVKKFIPPHLGFRKDVLRTVSTLSHPLW